jgi:hypothetical protein
MMKITMKHLETLTQELDMESKTASKSAEQLGLRGQAPAGPRKRFRIQKLEERIAPKKGGGSGQLSSGLTYSASVGGPY